jgi:hypothetical protein
MMDASAGVDALAAQCRSDSDRGMLIGLGLLAEVLTRIDMDGRDRRIDTLASQAPLPVVQPRPVLVQRGGARQ